MSMSIDTSISMMTITIADINSTLMSMDTGHMIMHMIIIMCGRLKANISDRSLTFPFLAELPSGRFIYSL